MKKYRFILCILIVIVIVFVFCSCKMTGGADGTADETPGAVSDYTSVSIDTYDGRQDLVVLNWAEYENRPKKIQSGTVLNYVDMSELSSQLPWDRIGDGLLWGNVYEGLLYMYMNDPEDIRGCIAESWSQSDDYLTWTFNIRNGVMFADGTVCNAPAIVKAWDYVREIVSYNFTRYNIASWEAVSETEFIVHLSAPCAWFEIGLCDSSLPIVSPTAAILYGTDSSKAAVGTGPYYIYEITELNIVLKANPDYYLDEKMPCIETVNIKGVVDRDAVLNALLSGEIDGASLNHSAYDAFNDIDNYKNLIAKGYEGNLIACPGEGLPLWLNAKTVPEFQLREVREAMCRFINFSAINDELYGGMGIVQDSLWAKGSSGYVPTDHFYYDPDEGHELLASVGMEASQIEFEVTVLEYQEGIYAPIRSQLNKSGVRMDFNVLLAGGGYALPIDFEYDYFTVITTSMRYQNTAPYYPWQSILLPDALFKMCFQDIYDPELYQKMLDGYDAMTKTKTWDEMLTYSKQLTTYVQGDFSAIGTIQPPDFIALDKDFKNGIYFSEDHFLQAYYLYK